MIGQAKWIGWAAGELGRRRTEPRTEEREEAVKAAALAGDDPTRRGSFLFRKTFFLEKLPTAASLAVAGLGFYQVTVNGTAPDPDRALAPVASDYDRRVKYDAYEVARLLREGENVIAAEVGPGWFTGNPKYWGWQQTWYGNPRLLAALELCSGGETRAVLTDETWKISAGCVTESCVYDGETQDLSLEPEGWRLPGFADAAWRAAALVEAPGGDLSRCAAPPVRITRVLEPVSVRRLSDTEYLFDFGENAAAIPRMTVAGNPGDTVTLRHAEFLAPDGAPDFRSENRALCTDRFTLGAASPALCMPRFTWHGYRYMTATLSDPAMEIRSAQSCVVHSDVATAGSFVCGDERLNELHETYRRTLLACLQGVPVDCPQRDERKGWLGDALVTAEACLYNFDMQALYEDWLEDLMAGRNPETHLIPFICPRFGDGETSIDWNLAYPHILTACYARYGDLSLLERHYETLRAHTEAYIALCEDGFLPPCWFGDWCCADYPPGAEKVAFAAGGEDHRQNPPFAATLFFCQTLRHAAEIARLTGHAADAARFEAQRDVCRKALTEKYYHPETGLFGSGGQFLQTYVLAEDILPEADRSAAFAALCEALAAAEYHPLVGIIGLWRLPEVLFRFGRPDLYYRVLTVEGYPGPLHMLSGGKTTLTETLDGGGSGCHAMFASPDASLYRFLGGIAVDRGAPTPVTVAPYCPAELSFVRCGLRIPEGEIRVCWQRENGGIRFEVEVPDGVPALLRLGAGNEKYTETLPAGGKRVLWTKA